MFVLNKYINLIDDKLLLVFKLNRKVKVIF